MLLCCLNSHGFDMPDPHGALFPKEGGHAFLTKRQARLPDSSAVPTPVPVDTRMMLEQYFFLATTNVLTSHSF